MGTPDPIANQGKILKSHGIERVKEHQHVILDWNGINTIGIPHHVLV